MMDQIADWILAVVNSVPILLGADQHHAELIRGTATLLLIVLVMIVIAMLPFRYIVAQLFEPRAQARPAKSVNLRVK